MPRRPKPPKHGQPDLVVQKLSTGEIVRPKHYVDELSGEVRPLPEHYGPHKPPVDRLAQHLAKLDQSRAQQRRLLHAVGIIDWPQVNLPVEAIPNKPKPKVLAHNQLKTESGLVMTIKSQSKPWRRM